MTISSSKWQLRVYVAVSRSQMIIFWINCCRKNVFWLSYDYDCINWKSFCKYALQKYFLLSTNVSSLRRYSLLVNVPHSIPWLNPRKKLKIQNKLNLECKKMKLGWRIEPICMQCGFGNELCARRCKPGGPRRPVINTPLYFQRPSAQLPPL